LTAEGGEVLDVRMTNDAGETALLPARLEQGWLLPYERGASPRFATPLTAPWVR
jgi:hypothetical protein